MCTEMCVCVFVCVFVFLSVRRGRWRGGGMCVFVRVCVCARVCTCMLCHRAACIQLTHCIEASGMHAHYYRVCVCV